MSMQMEDKNGWMVPSHDGYLEFPKQDDSGIAVTVWNHVITVQPHCHDFHEFALITKGYCLHDYQGVQVPLAPGDVFWIKPHTYHSYQIQAPIELINCQFYAEELNEDCNELLNRMQIHKNTGDVDASDRWNTLIYKVFGVEQPAYQSRQSMLDQQGVIHLDIAKQQEIESLLNSMIEEQNHPQEDLALVKRTYLQMILAKFKRIQDQQLRELLSHKDEKKNKIFEIIAYLEQHLDGDISSEKMAQKVNWSTGYFRTVFKEITSMTFTEYFTRLRMLKSLQYMEKYGLNVSEAAAKVGYYDPSYYSRLFKKVMGYSPKSFHKI